MSKVPFFSSPFLLGFDEFEQRVDRMARAADGYPPCNIERLAEKNGSETFLITIAVAGFADGDLEITLEDNQLSVHGRRRDDNSRSEFLHRGIAARQFRRCFLLADGMRVDRAELAYGLLNIRVVRPNVAKVVKRINISARS